MSNSTPIPKPLTTTYLPTIATYDRWASTYDTDGNILQSLDSYFLTTKLYPRLLAQFNSKVKLTTEFDVEGGVSAGNGGGVKDCLEVVDLGAGTGRATLLFLDALQDFENGGLAKDASSIDYAACISSENGTFEDTSSNDRNSKTSAKPVRNTNTNTNTDPTVTSQSRPPTKNKRLTDQIPLKINITLLDASLGMLSIAKQRIPLHSTIQESSIYTKFNQFDILHSDVDQSEHDGNLEKGERGSSNPNPKADVVICTLMLEHVPLRTFFEAFDPSYPLPSCTSTGQESLDVLNPEATSIPTAKAGLLQKGGYLVLTTMHHEMGTLEASITSVSIVPSTPFPLAKSSSLENPLDDGFAADSDSQREQHQFKSPHASTGAGFTDPNTGEKVRAASDWAHKVEDVIEHAQRAGFIVVKDVNDVAEDDHLDDTDNTHNDTSIPQNQPSYPPGVEEAAVESWMLEQGIVGVRGTKWVENGRKCWMGVLLRFVGR